MDKQIIFTIVGLTFFGVGIYFLISPFERCVREFGSDDGAYAICGQYLNCGGKK